MGQKTGAKMAERHPSLLSQQHDRQNSPTIRIGGQELIRRIARVQAQQPKNSTEHQGPKAQTSPGAKAEQQSEGRKQEHGQRNQMMAGIIRWNEGEQKRAKN